MNVLIFGATSTIAAEAAVVYARRGARLHLVGRNADKLAEVASRCGGTVTTQTADFANLDQNGAVVTTALDAIGLVDVVLIAHGDLGDQLASEQDWKDAERTLNVNFMSVVGLLIPLANHMEKAGAGRIGVVTSVAGDRGRPRNYTYGAAKGALNIYLQGLRSRLHSTGVSVTTLKLGPVDTPMTRDHDKNILFGKAPTVAAGIVSALDRRAAEAYVPSIWQAIMPAVKAVPEGLFQRMSFLSGR